MHQNTEMFVERRSLDIGALVHLITDLHADVKELDKKLIQHMNDETSVLAAEVASLMAKAFPEGDPDGHRRHHELVIEQAENRAKFWSKMTFELAKWGLVGFLGWLVLLVWQALVKGPR